MAISILEALITVFSDGSEPPIESLAGLLMGKGKKSQGGGGGGFNQGGNKGWGCGLLLILLIAVMLVFLIKYA